MKRILAVMAVLALATLALAADKPQTIKGHLVDVSCATDNQKKPKANFRQKHGKSCLQMPECVDSGYAILTPDDKIIKFDAASNEQAQKFIASTAEDKDFKVEVTGTMNPDRTLKVDSIKLQ